MGNRNNASVKQKKQAVGRNVCADAVTHQKIAGLASTFWATRGFSEGSAEEDWYRAEEELKRQSAAKNSS